MNYRLTKVTAIIMAAAAFVIVPGIYVLTSDAASKLVASFGTTQAASRSNRVALEAETFKDDARVR